MTLAAFQWVDWVITVIVVISTLISLQRGFFREALSLVIWVFAVIVSVVFHEQLAILLQTTIESPSLRKATAIICLFVLCLIVGGLLSLVIKQLIKLTGLTGTDRLLGMIFGCLRGIVIVIILLMIGKNLLPIQDEIWWERSVLLPHVTRLESWTVSMGIHLRDILLPLLNTSSAQSKF